MSDNINIRNTWSWESLTARLNFYYLEDEITSGGEDIYKGGGYFGFTPDSSNTDMGLFHMFENLN